MIGKIRKRCAKDSHAVRRLCLRIEYACSLQLQM